MVVVSSGRFSRRILKNKTDLCSLIDLVKGGYHEKVIERKSGHEIFTTSLFDESVTAIAYMREIVMRKRQ